jgi:hypothetical protein
LLTLAGRRLSSPAAGGRKLALLNTCVAITVALLAVAALTKIWWMYWLSWVPISFGTLMGLSGMRGC